MHQKLVPTLGCGCAASILLAFGDSALAQGVVAPPTLDSVGMRPAFLAGGTNQTPVASHFGLGAVTEAEPLLQLGPVRFHPHLLYRLVYGDGIPSGPNLRATTTINEIYPGVLFQVGHHWSLDYTPSFHFYSSSRFRDVTDQAVTLQGETAYKAWNVGLLQTYATEDQPLIETGLQTGYEIYNTALSGRYAFNDKLSLELGLNQNLRYIDGSSKSEELQGSSEWSSLEWLNYQFWPQLGLAIGAGPAYTLLTTGLGMTSEQLQARATWHPTEKLALVVSGGVDDRQFLNANRSDLVTPVFSVSITNQAFEATTIWLNANRAVNTSYLVNQIVETTEVTGNISQRFLKKLTLTITGGYRLSDFQLATSAKGSNREDHYTFVNVRLSAPFLNKHGVASLFYQASQNSSSDLAYVLSSTQVGFEVSYGF